MTRTILAVLALSLTSLAHANTAESDVESLQYWDDACRGNAGIPQSDPSALEQGNKACEIRDAIGEMLTLKGWCYGPSDVSEAYKRWYPCDKRSSFSPTPSAIQSELGEDEL